MILEPKGRLVLCNLTEEAVRKWKKNPEGLAEVAVELFWAGIRANEQNNDQLQREYMNMSEDVQQKAKENYTASEYDCFCVRFREYYAEIGFSYLKHR